MMFPKPPKMEKEKKGLKQKTPLKQYAKLEARTALKQNKKLEARTPLKQNKKLEAKSTLKQYTKLKGNINSVVKPKKVYKITKIRVNKRAIFSDFSKEEKMHIVERDLGKCIYCGQTTYLGVAHIFASRQKGGVGNRKNGVLLCQICHNALDNGKDSELREKIQKYCENYLYNLYGKIDLKEIIYDKNNNNDKRAI